MSSTKKENAKESLRRGTSDFWIRRYWASFVRFPILNKPLNQVRSVGYSYLKNSMISLDLVSTLRRLFVHADLIPYDENHNFFVSAFLSSLIMIVEDYEYVVGNRPTTYHVAIPKEISSKKPVLKLHPDFIKSRNCNLYFDEEFYHFLTFLTLGKANILWEAFMNLKGDHTLFQSQLTSHDKLVFMRIWRDYLSTLDIFREFHSIRCIILSHDFLQKEGNLGQLEFWDKIQKDFSSFVYFNDSRKPWYSPFSLNVRIQKLFSIYSDSFSVGTSFGESKGQQGQRRLSRSSKIVASPYVTPKFQGLTFTIPPFFPLHFWRQYVMEVYISKSFKQENVPPLMKTGHIIIDHSNSTVDVESIRHRYGLSTFRSTTNSYVESLFYSDRLDLFYLPLVELNTKILYVLGYLADPSDVLSDSDPDDDSIKVIVEELSDMNVEEMVARIQSLAKPKFLKTFNVDDLIQYLMDFYEFLLHVELPTKLEIEARKIHELVESSSITGEILELCFIFYGECMTFGLSVWFIKCLDIIGEDLMKFEAVVFNEIHCTKELPLKEAYPYLHYVMEKFTFEFTHDNHIQYFVNLFSYFTVSQKENTWQKFNHVPEQLQAFEKRFRSVCDDIECMVMTLSIVQLIHFYWNESGVNFSCNWDHTAKTIYTHIQNCNDIQQFSSLKNGLSGEIVDLFQLQFSADETKSIRRSEFDPQFLSSYLVNADHTSINPKQSVKMIVMQKLVELFELSTQSTKQDQFYRLLKKVFHLSDTLRLQFLGTIFEMSCILKTSLTLYNSIYEQVYEMHFSTHSLTTTLIDFPRIQQQRHKQKDLKFQSVKLSPTSGSKGLEDARD
ncbi:hypothetical protein LJB42_003630 [Komagataella kurtzmanii]|nr:hypothetical protein LJB42_003630 [Komagataella kurtzmanii]